MKLLPHTGLGLLFTLLCLLLSLAAMGCVEEDDDPEPYLPIYTGSGPLGGPTVTSTTGSTTGGSKDTEEPSRPSPRQPVEPDSTPDSRGE